MNMFRFFQLLIITTYLAFYSCKKDVEIVNPTELELEEDIKTENVIIIVVDGPRYTETWGDASHQYIPFLFSYVSKKSIVNTNFYNNGFTYTLPGHLALVSGQYYPLDIYGGQKPPFPTMFHYFNEKYPDKSSWIISSKDYIEHMTNTSILAYSNNFMANTDCGNSGLGSGHRSDSVTYENTISTLANHHPNLVLINFKEPDMMGHLNDWQGYLDNLVKVDSLVYEIFKFVENDPVYANKTTVFITNDHGRHEDQYGGFKNHGDNCEGCRHVMFFGYGPDFKSNQTTDTRYELIDIAHTTSYLLDFNLVGSNGIVMEDLFDN